MDHGDDDVHQIFADVERLFIVEREHRLPLHEQVELSFCCDENDEQNMITYKEELDALRSSFNATLITAFSDIPEIS